MFILKDKIKRESEIESRNLLRKFLVAKDILFQHFTQISENVLLPDLYGKTVLVTESTFPKIHQKRKIISNFLNIPAPDIFIYENFYYGSDINGLRKPWIEISSKTINDFSSGEITFLLAKQISHIYLNHFITKIHSEQIQKSLSFIEQTPGLNLVNLFGTMDTYEKAFQLIYYNWNREITHTGDIYGLLFSGSLKSANNCIIKLIINDKELSEKLEVHEYIKQHKYLSSLKGIISFYTKLDEAVPYGPIRIAELIKFLVNSENKKIFQDMKQVQEELNEIQ